MSDAGCVSLIVIIGAIVGGWMGAKD